MRQLAIPHEQVENGPHHREYPAGRGKGRFFEQLIAGHGTACEISCQSAHCQRQEQGRQQGGELVFQRKITCFQGSMGYG